MSPERIEIVAPSQAERAWEASIAAVRQAAQDISSNQWKIADESLKACPLHGGGYGDLAEFARRTGVAESTLIGYRTTADRWRLPGRPGDVAFGVCESLNAAPDRKEILNRLIAEGRATVRAARAARHAVPMSIDEICAALDEGYNALGRLLRRRMIPLRQAEKDRLISRVNQLIDDCQETCEWAEGLEVTGEEDALGRYMDVVDEAAWIRERSVFDGEIPAVDL
jgi:hypothetical protein